MSDCPPGAFGDEGVGAGASGLPAPAGQPRERGGDPWGRDTVSQREAAFPEVPMSLPPPPGALGNTAEMCSREGSSSLYAQWRGRWPVPSQATDGQTDGRQTEAQSEAGGQAVRGRRCEPQR